MSKRTWDTAIKNGLYAYVHRKEYAYFYGAKGKVLTDSVMNTLIQLSPSYFKKYTASEIEQIKNNSRGKIGYDCSGFVGWVCTGDECYSKAQINNCSFITNDLVAGVAGSILFTTHGGTGRHIGIDIGYGYCLDMGRESTDWAIENGLDSIRLRKILDCDWEVSGESNVIDYTGADSR